LIPGHFFNTGCSHKTVRIFKGTQISVKLSTHAQSALQLAREEAILRGHDTVTVEHLLWGILKLGKGRAYLLLNLMGCDPKDIRDSLDANTPSLDGPSKVNQPNLSKQAERVVQNSYREVKRGQGSTLGTEHILLAITKEDEAVASIVLSRFDVNYKKLKTILESKMPDENEPNEEQEGGLASKVAEKGSSPVLDQYSRDLTALAKENKLDPIIGRDREIERVAQILARRKKNNPVLIGDPGVGKTAIVEGLSIRIIKRQVSPALYNKRVVLLDLGSLVAGTKYRGQFEERIKAILNELEKNPDIIIFIDEVHTLVGTGSASGSLDAANMFKPALARGELQCIGATTLNEYRQFIEKDGALERRFQKVMVDAPTVPETIAILEGLQKKYEDHHYVEYSKEAVRTAVTLADRYITDRFLPDKALDVLDETGSRARLKNIKVSPLIEALEQESESLREQKEDLVKKQEYEKAAQIRDLKLHIDEQLEIEREKWRENSRKNPVLISADDIAEVVAMMTGIPVNRVLLSESHRLLAIEEEIGKRIIGQEQAIGAIARSIRRNRTGLKKRNRPIGSFIFLGPSGVGKTETAKVLSDFLFEDAKALIRIDMSEFMEKFNVSRLIGAPPGYIGYDEGGQLSEKVRRKPYSVVLLDEMEKAHPDVFNLLLQVLDAGMITDGSGRQVDFTNTILIMTANFGTRETNKVAGGFGFSNIGDTTQSDYREMSEKMTGIMKEMLRPEFVNRVDEVVVFKHLDVKDGYQILELCVKDLISRLGELSITLDISQEVKEKVIEAGFSRDTGARGIRRAVERLIEDPLSEEILREPIESNVTITTRLAEDKVVFERIRITNDIPV